MKKKEFVILAILVAVLAAVMIILNVIGSHASRRLVITVDGKEYQNFVLTDQTNKQITIETPYGYNEVVITNGVVDVVDADCENHVCVDTKPASKVFDKIVCLPHKLVIEIVGDGGETD